MTVTILSIALLSPPVSVRGWVVLEPGAHGATTVTPWPTAPGGVWHRTRRQRGERGLDRPNALPVTRGLSQQFYKALSDVSLKSGQCPPHSTEKSVSSRYVLGGYKPRSRPGGGE